MTKEPRRLGDFVLYRELGRGGFGTVHLGVDARGRRAAVKELHPHMVGDPRARELFRREVVAAQGVRGFCTAAVLAADPDAPRPWIASEYVEGPTLRTAVEQEGPRRGADLERLAVHTATALAAIHAAGVVHRDFKPDNIILGEDGPRVIDFGVARLAEVGPVGTAPVGTVGYMSPEQLEEQPGDRPVTGKADVFAWGATMVFAGTGAAAFPGDNEYARMLRVLSGSPVLGGLGGELRALAAACLAKDPDRRPSARALVDMLVGAVALPDPPVTPATVHTVPVRPPRPAEREEPVSTRAAQVPFQAPPDGASDAPEQRAPALLAAAEQRLLGGDGVGAEGPLRAAIAAFARGGDAGRADYGRILLGDLHNVAGRHPEAWRHLEGLRDRFEATGQRLHLARCLRGMALLDHGTLWNRPARTHLAGLVGRRRPAPVRGRPWEVHERVVLAERSLELFAEAGQVREAARTRLVLGQVLSEAGESERAVDAFSQAIGAYQGLGREARWWEARARRIAAQTRFHAVMEPNMAVGIYTGPEKEGWELSLVLANARRAAKLSGQAGDQRGRISAQILLARVVWASLGHADVEVGPTPASGTVSGSASAPSTPGAAARSAWYDRITTSEEVSGLLEASRAEAGENGLPGLVAEAALWQERFFEKSPGLYATGWEMSKRPRPVPFEESGLGRGDRCAV
ncbi:serine/threonine protein kinase [Nocardiopsis composta]|uniref:Tetratricopeptide (TPR) repeat protein n=1 Tax=Nocardiopsis composta TaxID=157465 RepID=A0A7W8QIA0_9ACTN|nr:serine/threonine-protein kinase [Nocardiopsis composta]MBB5430230.1 tetratricopeptide (TPR) repeat protein [Nocardiopsis composta]